MKSLSIFCLALFTGATLYAQTFNSPESVEYDAAHNRWIVGQNGSGVINTYSPASSALGPFATGLTSGPHGIEVLGDTVYACDGGYIRGYNITTGAQVFSLNLGASFLNGITSDGGHFLFTTDFTAKKIYRVNVLTNSFNLMCTTVKTPNGIYYDGANNRCVFVTWGSAAAIQAMSLGDSTVTTLYTTAQSNIDGITRDNAGYWYYTAWSNNSLMRIDPTFSTVPVAVMTGLSSPADIDINAAGDSIGIPNSGNANNVVFYTNITTSLITPAHSASLEIFPNPATDCVRVVLTEATLNAEAVLYDINGKLIHRERFSGTTYVLYRDNIAYGSYTLVINDEKGKLLSRQPIIFAERK